MEFVKESIGHGDLHIDAYNAVWEECLGQVLFLPSDKRFTRANIVNKKVRIESAEHSLNLNREHMVKEAKKAAKSEKKLKVLLGGYQARAKTLIGQSVNATSEIEQAMLEKSTFEMLQKLETNAIQKRVGAITADVRRQIDREKQLQEKFDQLKRKRDELLYSSNDHQLD